MGKKKLSKLEKALKRSEDIRREKVLKRKAKGIPVGFSRVLPRKTGRR